MKYTNKYNLPKSFVDVVLKLTYDISESDPKRLGVTTLISPPRMRLLSVRHWKDLEEDVSDHIWRITGNAYHYILSKIKDPENTTRLIEKKIEIKIDDITVVCKPDNYDKITQILEDWKVTSVWSLKLGDKEDWDKQLNCYAWILRKSKYPVKEAYINAILRDWRRSEVFKYNDYPKIPFARKKVNLWSFQEQEDFINERILIYKDAMLLSDKDLPICSGKERWQKECKYAVYKNQNKTASRVLENAKSAEKWAKANIKGKNEFKIVKREGAELRCEEYCLVNKFCSHWKENYGK